MVWVFTGIACGAGCFASVLLHPVLRKERNRITGPTRIRKNGFIFAPRNSSVELKMLAS
jgi:hypothetical protein